jgi:hypothetical protein
MRVPTIGNSGFESWVPRLLDSCAWGRESLRQGRCRLAWRVTIPLAPHGRKDGNSPVRATLTRGTRARGHPLVGRPGHARAWLTARGRSSGKGKPRARDGNIRKWFSQRAADRPPGGGKKKPRPDPGQTEKRSRPDKG